LLVPDAACRFKFAAWSRVSTTKADWEIIVSPSIVTAGAETTAGSAEPDTLALDKLAGCAGAACESFATGMLVTLLMGCWLVVAEVYPTPAAGIAVGSLLVGADDMPGLVTGAPVTFAVGVAPMAAVSAGCALRTAFASVVALVTACGVPFVTTGRTVGIGAGRFASVEPVGGDPVVRALGAWPGVIVPGGRVAPGRLLAGMLVIVPNCVTTSVSVVVYCPGVASSGTSNTV
jgi:hypothetical protein